MGDNTSIIWQLILWMVAAGVCFYWQLRSESNGVGLSLAYLLNLAIIHWTASALYAIPGYSFFEPEDVAAGLQQSLYAVISFSAGYLTLSYILRKKESSSEQLQPEETPQENSTFTSPQDSDFADDGSASSMSSPESKDTKAPISNSNLASIYIAVGAFCMFLGVTGLGNLPSLTAVVSGGGNFAVVGLMLKSWGAWQSGNRKRFGLWVSVSSLFPLITIVTQGFIGFGIFNTILILTFMARFYRPRWKLAVLGLALGYLGLSVYVTYMRDRNDIRASVWGGESYQARLNQLQSTFSQAEFFSLDNFEHLERIDIRLNQNALVGAAIHYLETGRQEYARGETLWQAVLAFVPRAIWPDKPVTAGSGNLVSNYTGMTFEEGTSVGVGQVMEFYINFGRIGVIIGFIFIGFIIAFVDNGAGKRLADEDWLKFAVWYLPGVAAMQVGGSLVEVTASAGGSLVIALVVKYFVLWKERSLDRKQSFSRGGLPRQAQTFRD